MSFVFYPKHQYSCAEVRHCPHLGGAGLAALVLTANQNSEEYQYLFRMLDAQRKRNAELFDENEKLRQQLEQVKLELKLERQAKFAAGKQKRADIVPETPPDREAPDESPRKRGAPVGHPGWFRPWPTKYDWAVDVAAPGRCRRCQGPVTLERSLDPVEHLQEDILEGVYRVVLYRHAAARCAACDHQVQKPGEGEILGSHIGPNLRSTAIYLRNVIGISYRKVPRAIEEMFGIRFTAAALIGFETMLAGKSQPVVDDIAKKLSSVDGPVHADETYSTLEGKRAYYWVHGDEKFIHFQFHTSRAGSVSRAIVGPHFSGTLVTDCYSGYHAHVAGAKQKCLAHLGRRARDWQRLTEQGTPDHAFFADVREFVKRGCEFHRLRRANKLGAAERIAEEAWLRDRLQSLVNREVAHEKALTLQARILRHYQEWLVFVDDPRVPPTNNLAERALRPLVVLRKITFGHRSQGGGDRMAAILTVAETARRHGHRPSAIFYALLTQPPSRVLRRLYAAA